MSEQIKITVVSENDKLNNNVDELKEQSVILTHDSSMTIMSTLLKSNLISDSFCGGRGDCGRCKIQFLKGATIPTVLERSTMEPAELRKGYRLACLAKPKNDCVIRLALADDLQIAILSNMIDVTENADQLSQQILQTENHKSEVMESSVDTVPSANIPDSGGNKITGVMNNKDPDVMIVVDLGTTTIAMQLMELDAGRMIDTYCEMNPQRRYGADVLSRIQASCEGNRETLQRLVVEVLERGVEHFRNQNAAIKCMCIAGNTTMEHLLMGYDVSSLGSSPFTPVEIGLQEYRHPAWDFKVWLTPGISAFVGGDIVAGLYACGMLAKHFPGQFAGQKECGNPAKFVNPSEHDKQANTSLLIDLGTNGEMSITDGTRMIVTATAAGPAFEGGASAGVVGSDMIACVAELLRQGILDETGLLAEPYFTKGVSLQRTDLAKDENDNALSNDRNNVNRNSYTFTAGRSESPLYIAQTDIRSLQMAKAAVRAGVEVLLRRMAEQWEDGQQSDGQQSDGQQSAEQQGGHSRMREQRSCDYRAVRVYLAGGFGYYLDVEAAFRIGLLPEYMRGHVQAVGNSSLMGAYQIGRDLWQHKIDKQALEKSISSIESVNLAKQEEFEELYIRHMNFSSYK